MYFGPSGCKWFLIHHSFLFFVVLNTICLFTVSFVPHLPSIYLDSSLTISFYHSVHSMGCQALFTHDGLLKFQLSLSNWYIHFCIYVLLVPIFFFETFSFLTCSLYPIHNIYRTTSMLNLNFSLICNEYNIQCLYRG